MLINPALLASLNVTRKQFDARVSHLCALLQQDDCLVLLACVRLYAFQTAYEQSADRTVLDNGVGFQYMDARFGGKMARLMNEGQVVYAHNMPRLRRMARKYRNQLAYLSFRKEQAKREATIEAQEAAREARKEAMAATGERQAA
jgi:hypothetical protein